MEAEKLIEIGGKLWKKGSMNRIYLDRGVCLNIMEIKEDKLTDMENKSLKKAKTFFDINSSELHSDVGTVRAMFNARGIKCVK